MTAKTPAQRKAEQRARDKLAGLVRVELYAHADDVAAIKAHAARLAKKRAKPVSVSDLCAGL